MPQQQYSPCPKIPQASSEGGENHYSLHFGSSSLVPLPSTDEKTKGRWSARQRGGLGSEGKQAKKMGSAVAESRSQADQAGRVDLSGLDPYDRRSFDMKGQTMHRSAMQSKPSHSIPKAPIIDTHCEHHYLPTINLNYTTTVTKENQNQTGGMTLQNSSRTLNSIPQIVHGGSLSMQHGGQQQQYSPSHHH